MEELHRLHKDVPFGWVLWLREMFGQEGRKRAIRQDVAGRRAAASEAVPDDLHCLSAPH